METNNISVEIAFARPQKQILQALEVPKGATVVEALEMSGLLALYPELKAPGQLVGIYGQRVHLAHPLEHNDRIELYRPLNQDPKLARLERLKRARTQ